jgi:hypothetical protein
VNKGQHRPCTKSISQNREREYGRNIHHWSPFLAKSELNYEMGIGYATFPSPVVYCA